MSDRPIIFSAPMVRALLEGMKTMTRRVVTHPIDVDFVGNLHSQVKMRFAVGDRLWVRETIRAEERCEDGLDGVRYIADDAFSPIDNMPDAADAWVNIHHYGGKCGRTIPPIHMPRLYSRLTLIVTAVKVERLQDISDKDAIAEGCRGCLGPNPDFPDEWDPAPAEEFRDIWKSIHGPGAWDKNPWVAAYSFEVIKGNIETLKGGAS